MSSTTTESPAKTRRRLGWGPPWSITGRLTLHYVGSSALLLLLAAGFLYWGLQQSLAAQDRALINSKFHVLRLLLREQSHKPDILASEVEHETSASESLSYYIRILDAKGLVLLESSGMSTLLPSAVFPPASRLAAGVPASVEVELGPKGRYFLSSGEAVTGGRNRDKRILQIALDVSHNYAILADYRRKLLAMLGTGIVFAAVLGMAVSRAGLRPLKKITLTTQRITASKLHERVAATHWPTELKALAGAFDAMLDRLEGSFTRLTQFTADIAHALRNPINNLRGEAEVALARARSPEEYQQILASSLEEYERLSRMIDGLLFIARADDPHAVLERVQFPVRREIEAVREFYDALASDHGVTVECGGEAWLTADPILFRRAVSNLLANALKHTPAGGRVTISACARADETVEVAVRDTGAGIAPEHLSRVFERFYQVDPSRDQTSNGTGLGLAIVQSIMRLHGGVASLCSTLGQGTTVTLTFPACASPPPQTPTQQ